MMHVGSVDDIVALYAVRGALRYGEGVTQADHAVQCAVLAEGEGASEALVVAALLHDVGHLLAHPEDVVDFSVDDRHEAAGAAALAALFGEAVHASVALHVSAKRYLCAVEPGYAASLSRASRASLAVQGGAFDRVDADAFERSPYWREAVALRRYDDRGKSEDAAGRSFADFAPLLKRLALA